MTDLQLKPVLKPAARNLGAAYEVLEDVCETYAGHTIRVPKGFQFDGASIPPTSYYITGTPFHPRFMRPAVFHDWLYYTHGLPRDVADRMFVEGVKSNGVGCIIGWSIDWSLRYFAGCFWANDSQDIAYLELLTAMIRDDGRDPAKYGLPPCDLKPATELPRGSVLIR